MIYGAIKSRSIFLNNAGSILKTRPKSRSVKKFFIMENRLLKVLLCTIISTPILQNTAHAQGWQALSVNRLIAINQFDNTNSGGPDFGDQMDKINVGIGTNIPWNATKLHIYSTHEDSHVAVSGVGPSIRFTDDIDPTISVSRTFLGGVTGPTQFLATSVPGDFVVQTRSSAGSQGNILFGTGIGTDCNGADGRERMRINGRNGYVGINVGLMPPYVCGAAGILAQDRLHVHLQNPAEHSPQEYVRIDNMPSGKGKPVVWDPISQRLFVGDGGGTLPCDPCDSLGLFWRLNGNVIGANPFWLGTIDNQRLVIKTNSNENMTVVPHPLISSGTGTIGVNTSTPDPWVKMEIFSDHEDSHLDIAGHTPTIRFSDQLIPNPGDVGLGWLGVAGDNNSYLGGSVPGDFVMQNRNPKAAIVFGTGMDCNGFQGGEKMRIAGGDGYVGINTQNETPLNCGTVPSSNPLDRLHIHLNALTDPYPQPQEYVRIDNMPQGEYNIVVRDPATGRLYVSKLTTGGAAGSGTPAAKEVQDMKDEIEMLKQEIASLKSSIASAPPTISSNNTAYYLDQNTPNPFDNTTNVKFGIFKDFKTATIKVTDIQGREVYEYKVMAKGDGNMIFNAEQSGTYIYSLIIDGHTVDSKKMISLNK